MRVADPVAVGNKAAIDILLVSPTCLTPLH
eukprot:SAG31_NODE_2957_length_4857_cov_47.100883_1_plen_29_part_10